MKNLISEGIVHTYKKYTDNILTLPMQGLLFISRWHHYLKEEKKSIFQELVKSVTHVLKLLNRNS